MVAPGVLLASAIKSENSPDFLQTCSNTEGNKMAFLLTLDDQDKSGSLSASFVGDEMSLFNSNNVNGRNRSRTNGYSGHKNNPHVHPNGQNSDPDNARYNSPARSDGIWRPNNGGSYSGQGSGFSPSHPRSSNRYNNMAPVLYDPSAQLINNNQPPRAASIIPPIGESTTPFNMVAPVAVWPTEQQLSTAYAYGICNDDGTYTRLIRADDLNRFIGYNLPSLQSPEGLIIVPPTRIPSPNSRSVKEQHLPRIVFSPSTPLFGNTRSQL
jgi:hypothetical protein